MPHPWMRKSFCGTILLTLMACAGVPPRGAQETPEPATQSKVTVVPVAPAGASAQVKDALKAKWQALADCDAIIIAIPGQQLQLKKTAYSRKQAGLLTTTAVGVIGSIVTAILAGNQKADANGNVDTKATTIVGASTAGATTIAGVVSLFVVGSGFDDMVQLLSADAKNVEQWEGTFNTACGTISDANADNCSQQATQLRQNCATLALTLPYIVPKAITVTAQ